MPAHIGLRRLIPVPLGRRLDSDALAYVARSGATNARTASSIFAGLKSLSVYDLLQEGYLFPSNLNAGTGTTAFGMKNFANATLTNGPVWGSTGVNTAGATNRYLITTASFNHSTPHTSIWIGSAIDTSRARSFFDVNDGSQRITTYRSSGSQNIEVSSPSSFHANIGSSSVSGNFCVGLSANGASGHTMVDGTVTSRTVNLTTSANRQIIIGNNVGLNISCGNNAAFLFFNAALGTQMADVYALLRANLPDLGLP